MTDLEKILIATLLAGGVGIVGKIVWSWLNNGKGEKRQSDGRREYDHTKCIYHAELAADIKEQGNKIDAMSADIGYIKGQLDTLVNGGVGAKKVTQ